MKNIFYYQTVIGLIGIAEKDNHITNLFFTKNKEQIGQYHIMETTIIKNAGEQLQEYLEGRRKEFCLPLAPQGTEFMKNVWNCLTQIPYGTTQSYKDIAIKINSPNAYRAAGNANNKNPIPVFIPCHRIIASNGNLAGYSGGIQIKSFLLQLETNNTCYN
jgi:methylated-DNA-[protein]-cysteine S-methyltransferase